MKWGAVLHRKWQPIQMPSGSDDAVQNRIKGFWSEDDTEYEITVPYQLRTQIIEIQNWLCDRYRDLCSARKKVCDIEAFFTYEEGIAPSGNDDTPMPHEQYLDDC